MTHYASLLRILLVSLASLVLFTACGEDEPAASEQAAREPASKPAETKAAPKPETEPAPVRKAEPPKTIAQQLEPELEPPDWYPSDAPLYPGAKMNRVGWVGSRVSGIFSTTDTPDEVVAWMSDFMASENWQNVTAVEMPTGQVMQGQKGNRALAVMVSALDSDGVEVTLVNVAADP